MVGSYLLGVCIGFIAGFIVNNSYKKYNIRSLLKNIKKELVLAYDEGVKFGAVKLQLERINEISKIQLGYASALDRPNASAAHARHKNGVVSQMKELDEEKIAIFKSILSSGVDPMLSISIDGEIKSLRASELLPYLEGKGSLPADPAPQTKTDSNSTVSAKFKLHVVKSTTEKDNGSSKPNPGNPAIH